MTQTSNLPRFDTLLARMGGFLRRTGSFLSKAAVGTLIVVAAGFVALATAIAGLLIAIAALVMRLGGFARPEPAMARVNRPGSMGQGEAGTVLDARRTARGWTVDPRA